MKSSITLTALAALLLITGPAMAGGMPSDEGPEILLEDGEELFTPEDASSLDSELPEYTEMETTETNLAALETTAISLPPASNSPPAHFSVWPYIRLHPEVAQSMR